MPAIIHRLASAAWLASLTLILVAGRAGATTYTYTPPSGGTNPRAWSDRTQWSPQGVPGPGDTAIVDLGPPTSAGLNAAGITIESLTVTGTDTGASLLGSLTVSGGTFDWQGGILESLNLVVDATSTLTITGPSDHQLQGGVFTVEGSATWDGQGLLTSNGVFVNQGTFTCLGGGSTGDNDAANQASFINQGVFITAPGSGDVIIGWGFQSTGTVELNGGNLLLITAGNLTHQFLGGAITGAGEVRVGALVDGGDPGAEADFGGLVALGNLELAPGGTFSFIGPGPDGGPRPEVTFDGGTVIWSGGTFSGGNFNRPTFVLSPSTSLQLSGDQVGSRSLDSARLESQGSVVYTGAGDVTGAGGATFHNAGTFLDETDGLFENGATAVLFNTGSLVKNGTSGTWVINGWALENQGTIDVETGVLALQAASDDDHVFLDGGLFEGSGIVRIASSSVDLYGTQTLAAGATLQLQGTASILNLDGATNSLEGPGTFLWTGGTIEGDFTGSLTVGAETPVTLSGSGVKVNDAVTLTLLGTTTWMNDDGGLTLSGNLDNQGLFIIACDSAMPFGNGVFTNEGTLLKAGTPGDAVIESTTVNSGTVMLESGTLRYDQAQTQGYSQTGGVTILDGGSLSSVEAGAGDDGGDLPVELDLFGGSLIGSGTVTGELNVYGTLAPGSSGGSVGAITLVGDLTIMPDGGTLSLELAGADAGEYDTVFVTGEATLGGTLAVSLAGGYTLPAAASFGVLAYASRSGKFDTIVPPPTTTLTADYLPTALVLDGWSPTTSSSGSSTAAGASSTGGSSGSSGSSEGSTGAATTASTSGGTSGRGTTTSSSSGGEGSTGSATSGTKHGGGCSSTFGGGWAGTGVLAMLLGRRRSRRASGVRR